tara:strand:+ start:850 stop:1620 length:771 start_codon:yes stop_codon:yes gene_type:complete
VCTIKKPIVVNVTSSNVKRGISMLWRRAFSPMHMEDPDTPDTSVQNAVFFLHKLGISFHLPNDNDGLPAITRPYSARFRGFPSFEAFWQSGKKFRDVAFAESIAWWQAITRPARFYKRATAWNSKIEWTSWDHVFEPTLNNGTPTQYLGMPGYVASRKEVYDAQYRARLAANEHAQLALAVLRKIPDSVPIVIEDFDGPWKFLDDGTRAPDLLPVTPETLHTFVNETRIPFGHGWVVASLLAGVEPHQYHGAAPVA